MYKRLITLSIISLFFTFTVNAKSSFTLPPEFLTKPDEIIPPPSNDQVEIPVLPSSEEMPVPQTNSLKMELTITPTKSAYKLGEYMSLSIESNHACYLTLVDFGTSGAVNIILPNKYQQSNYINANETLFVPNQRFDLKVGGATGREKIWGICTQKNTPIFQKHYDFNKPCFCFFR